MKIDTKGKKTYTGIATFVVGAVLAKYAPHLPGDALAQITPDLIGIVADGLMVAGTALATFGRAVTKPKDNQDVITPRPAG